MRASPQPLTLRPKQAGDDAFIAALAKRAFAEYDRQASTNTLRMARAGRTWLACRGGHALGFAVTRRAGVAAEVCAIAVEEPARGAGVGAALLKRLERDLAQEGVVELWIHTAVSNLSALDLFLKHGFRVERRLSRFYRGMYDACALCKRLDL